MLWYFRISHLYTHFRNLELCLVFGDVCAYLKTSKQSNNIALHEAATNSIRIKRYVFIEEFNKSITT